MPMSTRFEPAPATPTSHTRTRDLSTSDKKRLDGAWQDGLWWCNCEPREKAVLRQVKKDGPNKGKLFWTCGTYPFCRFFLWRDEAELRESSFAAAANNTDDSDRQDRDPPEPPPRPKTPTFTQRALESYGVQATPKRPSAMVNSGFQGDQRAKYVTPSSGSGSGPSSSRKQSKGSSPRPLPSPDTPSSKRKNRGSDGQDSDEFSDFDSDQERQLAVIADKSAQKVAPTDAVSDFITTPSTNQRATSMFGGLPTPSVSRTLFLPPAGERPKSVSFEDAVSPTPGVRSEISTVSSSSTGGSEPFEHVTIEVTNLLQAQKIDPNVIRAVHRLLDNASKSSKGIMKGRETARAMLKDKEGKIAKLQDRIRDLENRSKYDHSSITEARRKMMDIYENLG